MNTLLALLGGGGVVVAMVLMWVSTTRPGPSLERGPDPLAVGAGPPWGPILGLVPPPRWVMPQDTRGLGIWEHPRTGERLACLVCRDGWLWLWHLPRILVGEEATELVAAECRCGLVWRLGKAWHELDRWQELLPAERRPRPHRGTERIRTLGAMVHRAGLRGEPAPWWWPRGVLPYDPAHHGPVCRTCRSPAPDRFTTPAEPTRCPGCGHPWWSRPRTTRFRRSPTRGQDRTRP